MKKQGGYLQCRRSDQRLVVCPPFWRHNAEKHEVPGTCVLYELDRSGRNQDNLSGLHRGRLTIDVHDPLSFEDIVAFGRGRKAVGNGGLCRRDNGVGDTAVKVFCTGSFVGVEQFAENRPVHHPVVGAAGAVTDEHDTDSLSIHTGIPVNEGI